MYSPVELGAPFTEETKKIGEGCAQWISCEPVINFKIAQETQVDFAELRRNFYEMKVWKGDESNSFVAAISVLTFGVEEVHTASQTVEQAHVHEYPRSMVLHITRVLRAVVRVVPGTSTKKYVSDSTSHVQYPKKAKRTKLRIALCKG